MAALNGDSTARNYRCLLTTSQGGRIAYERVELAPRLMDDAWLDSFSPGTVGAAYREFVRRERLTAEGQACVRAGLRSQCRCSRSAPRPSRFSLRQE